MGWSGGRGTEHGGRIGAWFSGAAGIDLAAPSA